MDFIEQDVEGDAIFTGAGKTEEDIDDEAQDWSKLRDLGAKAKANKKLNKSGLKNGSSGEKEFEPLNDTNYDSANLLNARSLMYETLESKRGMHSTVKQINQITIFYNSFLGKCYMYAPKGSFLKYMGNTDKCQRCWLETEEVLYLVERGSCIVKYDSGAVISEDNIKLDEEHSEFEMSLEEIYSLLVRDGDYDNYCVYANLKRLGYIVRRTGPLDLSDNETLLPNTFPVTKEDYSHLRQSISQNLSMIMLSNFKNLIFRPLIPIIRFCKKILIKYQIFTSPAYSPSHFKATFYKSYTNIFQNLGIFSAGHTFFKKGETRFEHQHSVDSNSPYSSFTFDVWKPTPDFAKKNPPQPSYQVCVININKCKFPRLDEIRYLMSQSNNGSNNYKGEGQQEKRRFQILKNGYRNALLATVDHGVINYLNLKELDFIEEGIVWKDDNLRSNKNQSMFQHLFNYIGKTT